MDLLCGRGLLLRPRFGLALLLVVSFITYVTVYAADGRGNVGNGGIN